MYFPFGIRTRREGTMMLIALSLFFSLRPVSDADTSCALWSAEVLNTGGASADTGGLRSRAFRMIRWR
jgi:hypothetical protein